MKQAIMAITAIAFAALLFGCVQQAAPTPTPLGTATPTPLVLAQAVQIANDAFSPQYLTVAKGTTVTWTNNDKKPHSVALPQIDSGPLNPGQSFSYTFNDVGSYDYICGVHSYGSEASRVTVV